MMKSLLILCALFAMAAPAALARPHMRQSSIMEGQWLDLSPFSFTVLFDEAVTLDEIWLLDYYGNVTPVRLGAASGTRISAALPVLTPHHYRLHWRGHDGRGRAFEGFIGFAIRGCEDEVGTW